jgi:hypothetical protein
MIYFNKDDENLCSNFNSGDGEMNKIIALFYILLSYSLIAEEIPSWITNTKREDSDNHYIVCSRDARSH